MGGGESRQDPNASRCGFSLVSRQIVRIVARLRLLEASSLRIIWVLAGYKENVKKRWVGRKNCIEKSREEARNA